MTAPTQAPSALRQAWAEHWIGICATALILASETKLVLKDQISGAGSNVDIYIMVEVAVYAVVGAYLVLRSDGPPTLLGAGPLEYLPLAYVGYMAITVPFAPSPVYSAVRVLEMLVLLLLIRTAIVEGPRGWFLSFVRVFTLATAGLVLIGLTLPTQRGPLQLERFNWLATHPVVVGQFLALALTSCLVMAMGRRWRTLRGKSAGWLWAGVGVFSVALLANNTRGSAAAAAAGAAVAAALTLPRRIRASALLMVAYASALVLLTSTGVILGWLTRGETAEKLTSLNARLPLWELAWTTVTTSNPLFGLGIGASRSVFYDETGLGGAHNALLNVFVDLGVIGVLLWGWIIGVSVWVVVHRAAQSDAELVERALWLSTMTVLVVNGATSEGLGGVASVGVGWLFVLVGRAAQMDRERRGPISARADSPLMRQAQAGPGDRTGP